MPTREPSSARSSETRARQDAAAAPGVATAGGASAAAPAAAGVVLGPEAIRETVAVALDALRQWWGDGSDDILWLGTMLRKSHPELAQSELQALLKSESDMGAAFMRKMEARLERDVPEALLTDEPSEALRKVLEREKRYIIQRQQAMLSRSISTIERESLKRTSPLGAYWKLSPFVKEHTIDCVVMAGKFWPWEVLDHINPPRHANCPCRLLGLSEAEAAGLLPPGFSPPPAAESVALARELQERFSELREAAEKDRAGAARLVEALETERLTEGYDRRFPKGTVKGGEFMPRKGGFAAMVTKDLKKAADAALSFNAPRSGMHAPPASHEPHVPEPEEPNIPSSSGHAGAAGKPPKDFAEFAGRLKSRVNALGNEHAAKVGFAGLSVAPNEPDTAGVRHWDGSAELGKDAAPEIAAGAKAQESGSYDPEAASGTWLAYSRAAHEAAGHGVNPITPAEYSKPDAFALEEALAEEVGGRGVASDWLKQDGHEDALRWVSENPDHPRAIGAYATERARLGVLLDEAGVPEASRPQLLRTLAFKQRHDARSTTLSALVAARTGSSNAESAERVRATLAGDRDAELGIDFDPEPHLPLIPVEGGQKLGGLGGVSGTKPPGNAQNGPEVAGGPNLTFDAKHYAEPRRSLLRKLRALKPDATVMMADGTVATGGPKGSVRISPPDGSKGKLYSTPQKATDAELAGILVRHGVAGPKLTQASALRNKGAGQDAPPEEIAAAGIPLGGIAWGVGITPQQVEGLTPDGLDWLDAHVLGGHDQEVITAEMQRRGDGQHAPAAPGFQQSIPSYDENELQLSDFKSAGGSNGAQFATAKDGQKWLVKGYKGDGDRVATELLANAVYRALGIDVPEAGALQDHGPDFAAVQDEPLREPPLPKLPDGKAQSTGMVVVEPDGRMWTFEPKDHFGGYENTFSKGRLEPGLTSQQNARKELWEEMGIRANPSAYLGDFEGDATNTRMYLARRTSEPTEPTGGETEADGVNLHTPAEAAQALNKPRDQEVLKAAVAAIPKMPEVSSEDRVPPGEPAPKLGYPLVDGETRRWSGESQALGDGFMADALTGNWDVVGLEQDNVLWRPDGSPVRVDQGGTFEYRAMGKPKPFGPVPTEAWTMRGPKGQANGRMALDEDGMRAQAKEIGDALPPAAVDRLVDEAPFKDTEMRERVRENLKARVRFMREVGAGEQAIPGPLSGEDAQTQLAGDARAVTPLSPEEEDALHGFEGERGDEVQQTLRNGTKPADTPPATAADITALDDVLDNARAGEDFEAWMPMNIEGLGAADAASLAGKRFKEKGYLEATTDRGAAESAGKAVVRLLVPEGAHAYGAGAAGMSTEPGAVIFKRGTVVRIAGAREEGGKLVVDAVASPY